MGKGIPDSFDIDADVNAFVSSTSDINAEVAMDTRMAIDTTRANIARTTIVFFIEILPPEFCRSCYGSSPLRADRQDSQDIMFSHLPQPFGSESSHPKV